ncbi:MAG: helix-turn-helix transcriptional regulator [Gallionella sp.]
MPDIFPFKQTAIAQAIRSLRIYTRPPETAPEEKTQMDAPQPIAEQPETPQPPEYVDWIDAVLMCDQPAPAPVIFTDEPKIEQAALVRVIGDRLREAREMCNWSQSEVARRLGYSNPSKLSKVEGATDTNSVPLWLIVRAARLYEVSVDFLFGLTDDFEGGAPPGAQDWLLDAWQKLRERDLAAFEHLHREIAAVSQHTSELVAGAVEVAAALDRLRSRVPTFDTEMPASALLGRVENLQARARAADGALKRFHLGPHGAKNGAKA